MWAEENFDNYHDEVKKCNVGWECSTNWADECIEDIGGKARMKETTRKK
jgi:hypothetical protein